MKISGLNFPRKSFLFIILCIATISAFVFLVLYPNHQRIAEYKMEIKELENRIETHKTIIPVYTELVKRVRFNTANGLVLPDKTGIGIDQTNELKMMLRKIAASCKLELNSMIPDARSYTEEAGKLRVDAKFSGDFFNFQELLKKIGEVPYLAKIERIQIYTDKGKKSIHLKLLLIEKQGI